jgi:hypothetical protein
VRKYTLSHVRGTFRCKRDAYLKYDCNINMLSRVLNATLHLVARMLGLPRVHDF